jgi:gluconolactonase
LTTFDSPGRQLFVEVGYERLLELVSEDAAFEQLGSGFDFVEGPIWIAADQQLLFSDVRGNARYRWSPEDGVARVVADTAWANGMTLDADGRLIVCEGGTGAVVAMDADGSGAGRVELASEYEGRHLNSPNDVIVATDGSIYFTDPWWAHHFVARAPELDFKGVYRLRADGELELLAQDLDFPNGLCLAPDESRLYVNDSTTGTIHAFDVTPDGAVASRSILADGVRDDTGFTDGMKCDERGNLWVTGPAGIWVFDAAGTKLGVLRTPERVGNLHWGGADWRSLFVCATGGLYRLPTLVAANREPFMH